MSRLTSCLVVMLVCAAKFSIAAEISFNRDVRPILSDKCYHCHGPDKSHRKAKLRLDQRESALENGAIVPGKPDQSELVSRIFTDNPDDIMPPPDAHKTLTAEQKRILKEWVAQGAKYEPHWSFITPTRPAVPKVQSSKFKVQSPIDAFVLAELQAQKVEPSAEADRRTLLRRLSLDLTGLPPTPAEMESFLKDKSKNAYEKQVDRLLASRHFGERMAVPWLDVVRFSDTVGYHGDQNVNVFPYRDYVINAFNANKRFDQFTIEQLAGDLLPNNTVEQRIATGFNRLNMMTREGGAQPKEYLAKYGADRARTVGMAWLGLTVGCAECHDHKFDPFTTKDFYSLKAFFADVKQWGVYNDYKYTPNPDLKGWSNDHPFPPEEVVESPYLKQRMARLRGDMVALARAAAEANRESFKAWKQTTKTFLKEHSDGWAQPTPLVQVLTNASITTNRVKLTNVVADANGAVTNVTNQLVLKTNTSISTNFVAEADGTLVFGNKADGNSISLRLKEGTIAALRVELVPHDAHKGSIFRGNRTSGTVQLTAALRRLGDKKDKALKVYHADADHKEPRYANGYEVIGIADQWKVARDKAKEKQTGVWFFDPPLQARDGETLVLNLKTNVIGAMRISVSPISPAALVAASRTGKDEMLSRVAATPLAWLVSTAADTNAFAAFKKLHRDYLECRDGTSPTLVTVSWQPEVTRVLPRGNWLSDSGEIVEPMPPHFLPQPKRDGTNRLSRLDLARWLVSADNPLTARTVMNRLWKQFFGSGLANPVDDLGLQGELPSHPELLDWLAVEFRESGWNVKHMVRLLVTSSTYKQSSNVRRELLDRDPNNRWLAYQNPRRLEAEFVRDNALFVAGLLNLDLGGPSAKPYQPAGYYSNLQFPDRDYIAHTDDRQYRRGLYMHWQRTFLHPMLANFDAPAREECVAIRTVSNTPQQALTLLNDPTFFEASRAFAQKLLEARVKSDEQRIRLAFDRALGRSPKAPELQSLTAFLAQQRAHYSEHAEEAPKVKKVGLTPAPAFTEAELAAWTQLARVVLNLHETVTRY